MWKSWARLGFEAQHVMALRLARLAMGGAPATREASRMVSEKAAAGLNAQFAAALSMVSGRGFDHAAGQALGVYKRAVRRNRRRLSRSR
jgi:hypothetical protein